jgi:hypothetical protein
MKKTTIYAIPVVLCAVAFLLLVIRSRKTNAPTPAPVVQTVAAKPAPPAQPQSQPAPAPVAPAAKQTTAVVTKQPTAALPASATKQAPATERPAAPSVSDRDTIAQLTAEKQRLYDAVKAADRANSELSETKSRLEEALATQARERKSDAAKYAAENAQSLAKLRAEIASANDRIKAAQDELAPLKARENARQEALKKIPAPVVINP